MLEAVRRFAASTLGKAVFVVVLITFAGGFWYVGSPLAPGGGAAAITVGDRAVPVQLIEADYRREVQRMQREMGEGFTPEMAREMGLRDRVIGTVVDTALLDLTADTFGLVAGDDQVRRTIVDNPSFHGAGGRFDRDVYAQTLALNGFSESSFEALVRDEIARQQLLASIQAGAIAPPALTRLYYRVAAERRIVEYVAIAAADPASLPVPEDAALRELYDTRSVLFTAPEYRALSLAAIHVDDVAAEVSVSDAEIAAAYDERAGDFASPEQRSLRQIVVQDEATARRIVDRLRQGADFAAVAAEEAGLKADQLSLGSIDRSKIDRALADAAFALKQGEVSDPVKTVFGWTIVTVDAIEPGQVRPLDAVADTLRQDLARERAAEAVYDLGARLQDSLAAGTSLEQAAAALNLRLQKVEAVDSEGKDPAEEPVADLATQIVTTAFRIDEGTDSPLTDLADGSAVIVRVDRVIPRAVRPFEQARDKAIGMVRQQRAAAAAGEIANAFADRVRGGAEFAAAAGDMGLKAETSAPFDRSGDGTPLPKLVVEVMFDKPAGEVVVIPFGQFHVVARVTEIVAADPAAADPTLLSNLRTVLTRQIREEVSAQLIADLRRRYPVSINQAAFPDRF